MPGPDDGRDAARRRAPRPCRPPACTMPGGHSAPAAVDRRHGAVAPTARAGTQSATSTSGVTSGEVVTCASTRSSFRVTAAASAPARRRRAPAAPSRSSPSPVPAARVRSARLRRTRSGSSSVRIPRLSDVNGPSLTPPSAGAEGGRRRAERGLDPDELPARPPRERSRHARERGGPGHVTARFRPSIGVRCAYSKCARRSDTSSLALRHSVNGPERSKTFMRRSATSVL